MASMCAPEPRRIDHPSGDPRVERTARRRPRRRARARDRQASVEIPGRRRCGPYLKKAASVQVGAVVAASRMIPRRRPAPEAGDQTAAVPGPAPSPASPPPLRCRGRPASPPTASRRRTRPRSLDHARELERCPPARRRPAQPRRAPPDRGARLDASAMPASAAGRLTRKTSLAHIGSMRRRAAHSHRDGVEVRALPGSRADRRRRELVP